MRILLELMIGLLQLRVELLKILVVILVKGFGRNGTQFSDFFDAFLNLLLKCVLFCGQFFEIFRVFVETFLTFPFFLFVAFQLVLEGF